MNLPIKPSDTDFIPVDTNINNTKINNTNIRSLNTDETASNSELNTQNPDEKEKPLLSILMPVYNEQAYLSKIVRRVLDAPVCGLRREIVMVNDASSDKTAQVMEQIQKRFPETVRIFHQSFNQGKGAAIRRAVQEMKGDFAIIQDADLEYDPNEYPIVLRPLLEGRADVVYGSRFATREMRKVLFYHHKLGNLFLTSLSNLTTGLDLTDMETCYKAFRGELLKSIPLRSNRFGMEPEITAKIAKRGFSVYEVPISYHGRRYSEGKKIGWKDGISAIYTILKYWLIDDCFDESVSGKSLESSMNQSRNYIRRIAEIMLPWLGTRIIQIDAGIGNLSRRLPQREHLTLTVSNENDEKILKNSYDGNVMVDVQLMNPLEKNDINAVVHSFQEICRDQFWLFDSGVNCQNHHYSNKNDSSENNQFENNQSENSQSENSQSENDQIENSGLNTVSSNENHSNVNCLNKRCQKELELYDSVILSKTLAQTEFPDVLLQNVKRLLNPSGHLILLIPKCPELAGPLDELDGYRKRFSTRKAIQLLDANGFCVETKKSFNRLGYLMTVLHSVVLRRKKMRKLGLKIFDFLTAWGKYADRVIPCPGATLMIIASLKPSPKAE